MKALTCSLAAFFLTLSLTGCVKSKADIMQHKNITLNNQRIDVELAATSKEQQLGLSGRTSLAENQGMLFALTQVSTPSFWMKDMLIPIDILWIYQGAVIGFESNVVVDDGRHLYSPKQPVDSVLELSAGWTSRHGTLIGDRIE